MTVVDGETDVLPYMHYFYAHFMRSDDMFRWLVKNGITGKQFIMWVKFHWGVSMLEPARHILSRLEKRKEFRPVLLTRDVFDRRTH